MTRAFVLSGGGNLGAVQVGMLDALRERGIVPDLLVGASVGALNAAYIAGRGMNADAIEDLTTVWLRVRRRDLHPNFYRRSIAGDSHAEVESMEFLLHFRLEAGKASPVLQPKVRSSSP